MTWRRLVTALSGVLVIALMQLPIASTAIAAPLTSRPQMALGFDDVPQEVYPLLSILDQKHVKATFFVVGELAEAQPAQLRAVANDGMLIGNHSYDHPDFTTATAGDIESNLAHAQTVIRSITGITPHWYRSPFLAQNPAYATVLPKLGLRISWPTINPKDWAGTAPADIINIVRTQEAPGGVVELHDMVETNTVTALPDLIDGLHADGYDLVTLDDIGLGAIEGNVTEAGGSAIGGAVVTAYDTHGAPVETATSRADGSYRLARLAPASYRVGFTSAGHFGSFYSGVSALASATAVAVTADHTKGGANAALVKVPVIATTTKITAPSSVKARRWLKVSGTLSPSIAPGKVEIAVTRLVGRTWKSAGVTRVVVSGGRFSYRFKPRSKGRWRFVATYRGATTATTIYRASKSGVKTVRVK